MERDRRLMRRERTGIKKERKEREESRVREAGKKKIELRIGSVRRGKESGLRRRKEKGIKSEGTGACGIKVGGGREEGPWVGGRVSRGGMKEPAAAALLTCLACGCSWWTPRPGPPRVHP